MRKPEAILLCGVGCRAVEIKLAAADLQSRGCIGSQSRRSEGIHLVVVVTAEEAIVRVEPVIDAHVKTI